VANNRATEEEKTWRARRSLRPTDPEGAAPGEKGLKIGALGFQIAFHYGITGFACGAFCRRELTKSARNFFTA
jgi:hypothetical protein